jgi:hypothetical protein
MVILFMIVDGFCKTMSWRLHLRCLFIFLQERLPSNPSEKDIDKAQVGQSGREACWTSAFVTMQHDAICSHSSACSSSVLLWLSHGFPCHFSCPPLSKLNGRCSLHSLSTCKFGPSVSGASTVLLSALTRCAPLPFPLCAPLCPAEAAGSLHGRMCS